jgi:hypothetical protein
MRLFGKLPAAVSQRNIPHPPSQMVIKAGDEPEEIATLPHPFALATFLDTALSKVDMKEGLRLVRLGIRVDLQAMPIYTTKRVIDPGYDLATELNEMDEIGFEYRLN